jgi:hypothetical protein
MVLPRWDSLDSVKRISDLVQVVTLCCWGCLVLFEIMAHFWKKRSGLFTALALVSFALAVAGEVGEYKYSARKDQLHEDSERALGGKADTAVQRALDAESKANAVQNKFDNLTEKMKWREITASQKALLGSKLSPFKGTTLVMIYMAAGGEETQHYAEEIAEAIRGAGWTVGVNMGMHNGPPRYDLTVEVNDKLHPHAATMLIETLRQTGFRDVQEEADPNLSKDGIQLVVRPKPHELE